MSRRFYGVLTVSEEDLCFSILMDRLWIIFFLLGVSGLTAFAEVSEEARKYHQLLLKKPGNDTVFERFLEAWLTTGDREGLEVWLEGEAEGGTVGDWQILATYYEDLGESGEALAALDRGVKMDEGKLSLKLSRAKLRAKGMDFEGALEDLKPVVEDVELGREAMTLRGVYEVRIGRPNDAVRTWEALVKRFPGDEALREDLIEIEIGEGLFERAIESSRSLVDRTKDPYKKALRRLRLAEVYGLADRKEESLATYGKVMAASGEGTWLEREVLSQVEQIYVWEDDVQGLRDYYQKLRENYPRRTSVRKALAKQMARNDEQ
jgi:tetratricopeptide (TPR) repeat protein